MSVDARGGYRYFLAFTDDLSIYGYIYLMKHKSETFEKFKEFQSEVENHRNKKIRFYDLIMEENIWVTSLVFIWNNEEQFRNSRHQEHHNVMVCLNVVTTLY